MRQKIVAGNWKMNLTFEQADDLLYDIQEDLEKREPGRTVGQPRIRGGSESPEGDRETGQADCQGREGAGFLLSGNQRRP